VHPVTLRTERLTLSAPTDADVDAIYAACQDPGIQRYTTLPSPYERSHAEGFIASVRTRWADQSEATWAIREGGSLAGMIGINGISTGGTGEIGYWMTPAFRGRALLTEAARAVIDWGFSDAGPALQRIEWRAVAGNIASARAARRLGFRFEGVLRGALVNSSGRDDGWIAGLLPHDERAPQPWPVLNG
jgi:RimJ/RimL family protein N-acetyltransferase